MSDPFYPVIPRIHVIHVPGVHQPRDEIVARLRLEADACVHEDPDRNGLMWNWLGAMRCAAEGDVQTWSYIVSDDADPFDGWQEHLRLASFYSPAPLLALSYLGGYGKLMLQRGVPYGMGANLVWGVAIGYHRSLVVELYQWCARIHEQTGYPNDDYLVASFALGHRLQTAMVARALFDVAQIKSLMGHALHQGKPWNRPSHTIENSSGPFYGVNPRYVMVKRPMTDQQKELAHL